VSDLAPSPRLAALGWTSALGAEFASVAREGSSLGRVSRADRGYAHVVDETGERLVAVPKGLTRDPSTAPVTGDWAELDPQRGVLRRILPRHSAIVRRAAGRRAIAQVVAANVEVAFIVMGLDGDFNPRRVERYLALVRDTSIVPVVLLTKAAIASDVSAKIDAVRSVAPGLDVHAIDVLAERNAEAPRSYLGHGRTAVLLGSSGVGKSTLVNHLLGDARVRTAAVREHDDRGKHTTTARELHELPSGGVVVDTPGMRELALFEENGSLEASFPDVLALAEACRFRDCRHLAEPACAVRAGVDDGSLSPERLAGFARLRDELSRATSERVERERKLSSSAKPRRP
jgi:ribosome biogenesis GTPase